MKILSIHILRLPNGHDRVILNTDLPGAAYPYNEPLSIDFKVSRGGGPLYVAQHFPGIPVTETDYTRHGR
jgi:hypothetical protein